MQSQTPERRQLAEGKTKVILEDGEPGMCIIRNKTAITANDDPSLTKQISSKPVAATTTTTSQGPSRTNSASRIATTSVIASRRARYPSAAAAVCAARPRTMGVVSGTKSTSSR